MFVNVIWDLIYETKFLQEKITHKIDINSVNGNICTNLVRYEFSVFYGVHYISGLLAQIWESFDINYLCMSSTVLSKCPAMFFI